MAVEPSNTIEVFFKIEESDASEIINLSLLAIVTLSVLAIAPALVIFPCVWLVGVNEVGKSVMSDFAKEAHVAVPDELYFKN